VSYGLLHADGIFDMTKQTRSQLGIGQRITRLLALVTFLAVLTAALAHTVLQTRREIENRVSSLQATAYTLAAASGDAVVTLDKSQALSTLTAVNRIPNIILANIILPDKSTFATMGQTAYLSNDILTSDDGSLALLYKGLLPVAVDIVKGGEVRGQLLVVEDIRGLRAEVATSVLVTFAIALLAAMLGVTASHPLQWRIVGPLITFILSYIAR
jgi:hypothetical protein